MLYISLFVLELNNIIDMKRAIMIFLLSASVIAGCWMWLYYGNEELNTTNLLTFGVIILVLGFAVLVGIKRLKSANRGEPPKDEMSKKVILRTAALSYYISLYLWVILIYIKDKVTMDTEEVLGTGILAMAVVFACCWLYFNFRGVRSE